MSKYYMLTQKRTKDLKPRVYGEVGAENAFRTKLASAVIGGHRIDVFASDDKTTFIYDNFVAACLPGNLAHLCTTSKHLCLVSADELDLGFWHALHTHPVQNIELAAGSSQPACHTRLLDALKTME